MAGEVLEYRGVGGRDTELSQLHLRRRPGQLQRSPCRVLIVIATRELEETLARGGDECRESGCRRLTWPEAYTGAQCEDWIEHRAGGARQRAVALQRHGLTRRPPPAEKSRAVGLVRYGTDAILARVDDVRAPERLLRRRAGAPGGGNRRTPLVVFRLDEQVRECRMRAIPFVGRKDNFAVARELDFTSFVAVVDHGHPPHLGGILRDHRDLGECLDVAVGTME